MDNESFAKKLSEYAHFIGYTPMEDEPAYADFLSAYRIVVPEVFVPQTLEQPPEDIARQFTESYDGASVALFIPGRQFDATGTRHGRGHGWYDRFLSQVPKSWFRVGVLHKAQLSPEKLERKSWDEPMDALLVEDSGVWRAISPS